MALKFAAALLLPAVISSCPCCPTCEVCPCGCPDCEKATTKKPEPDYPLMKCPLNCYGESAKNVPLPGSNGGDGIPADSIETCRDFCFATEGCQGVVYGQKMCYGKKDIHTAKCQPGGTFYTEILTAMPLGTCVIMGDPHVLSFDNPMGQFGDLTQTTAGDYHLIKSAKLQVQGRFGYSPRFPSEASLMGLAVSGSLINNNNLIITQVGGVSFSGYQVFWNGVRILEGFPASYQSSDGFLKAKLDNVNPDAIHAQARHTIGGSVGSGVVPSFLFQIAPDISIYCLVGDTAMNTVITMRLLEGGMDGYCGNFNCDGSDDDMENVKKRGLGGTINATGDNNLFKGAPPIPPQYLQRAGTIRTINDCNATMVKMAQKACALKEAGLQDACIFDVCASGQISAGQRDVLAEELASEVGAKYGVLGIRLPSFLQEAPAAVQWAAGMFFFGMIAWGAVVNFARHRHSPLTFKSLLRVGVEDGDADEEEALLAVPPACEYEPITTGR